VLLNVAVCAKLGFLTVGWVSFETVITEKCYEHTLKFGQNSKTTDFSISRVALNAE